MRLAPADDLPVPQAFRRPCMARARKIGRICCSFANNSKAVFEIAGIRSAPAGCNDCSGSTLDHNEQTSNPYFQPRVRNRKFAAVNQTTTSTSIGLRSTARVSGIARCNDT